ALVEQGFDYCYDKTLYDLLVEGSSTQHYLDTHPDMIEHGVHFIENHDEQRAATVFALTEHTAAAQFIASLPGLTMWHDGQWQGFEGEDLEAVIDLGAVQKIGSLCATFLQDAGSWIFWPKTVSFALSRDGRSFTPAGGVTACEDVRSSMIKAFRVEAGGKRARYVRVTGVSVKVCPPDHRAAGSPAWLFVDEVVIE
ncbi:MAG TPA: discoidin domain-containing protein, partial [bacterium]|nr:discoidin domain-containing protein [bacterium]